MLDKWFAAAGAAAWGGVAFRRLLPFLSTGAREKVETLCPAPETVLVAAFPYYAGERPGNLSLYARGEDYHRVVTRRLNTVCDALRRKYPEESFVPAADNSPLPEREAAWLAGIGLRGKNGLLILPPYGTSVFLGTILTGAALDVPERPAAPDCPGCGACRAACPAGALGEGGPDVSRCLSELTQKKGALTEEETAVFRRGRNAQVHSVPHHASRAQYSTATALEALFGWLYLSGQRQRVSELFDKMMEE